MSTLSLSAETMNQHFARHAGAELAHDLETTMATVSDHPVFEVPSIDLRVTGRDAVREMYRRYFDNLLPKLVSPGERFAGVGDNTLWSEYVYGIKEDDGEVRRYSSMTIVVFTADPLGIVSEITYAQPGLAKHYGDSLGGEDIFTVPGCTRISHDSTTFQAADWTAALSTLGSDA